MLGTRKKDVDFRRYFITIVCGRRPRCLAKIASVTKSGQRALQPDDEVLSCRESSIYRGERRNEGSTNSEIRGGQLTTLMEPIHMD